MSLYENINNRKKAGTSRSKKNSTVSDKSYSKMKAGFRSGGMANQMADQMDISKQKASGLMNMAKRKNDAAGYMKGGHVYVVAFGSEDVPVESGRKEIESDTEQLIQGTESQVRARYFNNNDGKGTF